MAYPLEQENVEYMDYVLQQQEAGQPALSKEQWRLQRQPPQPPQPPQPNPQAVQDVTNALLRR